MTGNIGALSTPLVVGPLLDHFSTIELINGEATRITDYNPMFALNHFSTLDPRLVIRLTEGGAPM